jgi:NDP-sugar pyrophosphorylase family protein
VILRQLVRAGFEHITLAVNHQAELIKTFFGDGAKWRVRIDYSLEDQPLGTMGPLRLIRDLPEDFLIMNGDVLTDLDFAAFFEHHVRSRNLFTISAHRREQIVDYGVLEVDRAGKLSGFKEKPSLNYEVSMGIYMASRKILELIPRDTAYGFDHLMLELIATRQPAAVKSHDGYWLDIGRPDDYAQAIDEFEKLKPRFLGE